MAIIRRKRDTTTFNGVCMQLKTKTVKSVRHYKVVNIEEDPTSSMSVQLWMGCQQLLNLMGAFSMAVSNVTVKMTRTLWRGPPLVFVLHKTTKERLPKESRFSHQIYMGARVGHYGKIRWEACTVFRQDQSAHT